MNRISIVGISGSGKSTLANKLGKKLNLPVFHLDKYYWTTDWKKQYPIKEEFKSVVKNFTEQDKWIIDGNFKSANIDSRFERADAIIFLDIPKWRCIWRVFIRAFNTKHPFDKVDYKASKMRKKIAEYKDIKRVFIIRNNKEINNLIISLGRVL